MQRLHGRHLCDPDAYHLQLLMLTSLRSGTASERRAYYAELEAELAGAFSLADYLRTATNHQLMEPLLHHEQFDLFEAFVRERAAALGTTVQAALNDERGVNFYETIILYDRVPEAWRAVELFDADLLAVGGYEQKPLILLFIRDGENDSTRAAVVEWIAERWQSIDAAVRAQILRRMFEVDWADGLRVLFDRFPAQTGGVLFNGETADADFELMMGNIEQSRLAATELLIEAAPEIFADPQRCVQLIVNCAYARRSHALLKRLLELPAADVLLPSALHSRMLPFGPALHFRQLLNFHACWARLDAVVDRERIAAAMRHADGAGNTLLMEAVWSWQAVADEGPWTYRPEPQVRTEMADSDDDEVEVERKRRFNATEWSLFRMDDVVYTDEYYKQQELEYRQVWNQLLEAGSDPHAVNPESGQTLVHMAVQASNEWLVQRLLDLQVPVWRQDAHGRNPLHLCRNAQIARLLLDTAEAKDYINQPDADGQTPLHSVCAEQPRDPERIPSYGAVVACFLAAGADVHASVPSTGCTALHLGVHNADYTRLLLEAGAAVNARDAGGRTPAHYIVGGSGELFVRAGDQVEWKAMSHEGVSILPSLLTLPAAETDRMGAVLDAHRADIRHLFVAHWRRALDSLCLCQNERWVREFCAARPSDLPASERVKLIHGLVFFNCSEPGELLLIEWLRQGGVNFAYLLGQMHENIWSHVSSDCIRRMRALGAEFNIAGDEEAQKHALDAKRWRGCNKPETLEALAMCVAGGADWRRREAKGEGGAADTWMLEKFDLFAVLVEWEQLKSCEGDAEQVNESEGE